MGRKARNPGLMTIVFVLWYGTVRLVTDFLRVDKRYLGLTGSQIVAIVVALTCLYLLARYRGAPPRFRNDPHPITPPDAGEGNHESLQDGLGEHPL